jgi:hypothetical protein
VADTAALRALPAVPLEPCEKRAARVSSMALVRYRTNDYSVPTAYGFQDVIVKGFVDAVVILCGGTEIARHPRCYGEGTVAPQSFDRGDLLVTQPVRAQSRLTSAILQRPIAAPIASHQQMRRSGRHTARRSGALDPPALLDPLDQKLGRMPANAASVAPPPICGNF